MIIVILSWTILFLVFLSFGEGTVCLWNRITKQTDCYALVDKFWIGICSVGTILLLVSIFFPLNIVVLSVLLLISLLNIRSVKGYAVLLKEQLSRFSLFEKVLVALVLVAVLLYSLSTPLIYDEGLYHLQTMQWNEKFSTVLGLGNVHGRLGFNSSFLLLSTVFNYHPSVLFTAFTINSLALFVFAVWLLGQIATSKDIVKSVVLSFVLLIALFSLGANVSSTSTDILPNILIMYLLLNWALDKDYVQDKILVLAFLSLFCITLKLSSAAVLLVAAVCLIALYKKREKRTALAVVALGCIVFTAWIIRFVMLTGYIVYPFPAIDIFSVDWKIPLEMVVYEKDIAYAWARIPDMEAKEVLAMNFTEWFPIWLKNLSYYNLVLYLLAFLAPILLIVTKSYHRINIGLTSAIALAGVIFGLLTAPDFRFGLGFIVCAGVIPFLGICKTTVWQLPRLAIRGGLAICLLGITYIAYSQVANYQKISDNTSWSSLIIEPQSTNLLKDKASVSFDEYRLNGVSLFVPQGTNQCFDQPVPCAPYYNNNLEMRGIHIQDGFKIKK